MCELVDVLFVYEPADVKFENGLADAEVPSVLVDVEDQNVLELAGDVAAADNATAATEANQYLFEQLVT